MGSPCLCLSCSAVILENHQKILSFCKNYINATVPSILFASRGLYNLWAPNAESHVIYCIYTNNTTSTIFYLSLKYILWVLITFPYIIVLPTSLIIIRDRPSKGVTYVQSLNFKTCCFAYWGGGHVAIDILLSYLRFSLSLSQFQSIFVSFVAISAALCRCFKDMFCLSKFCLTGPQERGQHKWLKGRAIQNTAVVCTGLMDLKYENEKKGVWK